MPHAQASHALNAGFPPADLGHASPAQLALAERFVTARQNGAALMDLREIPADLIAAYAVQDAAIRRWADHVAGWKVGYIAPEQRGTPPDERLLGPIFSRNIWVAGDGPVPVPVFAPGGFGAVEAEYVLRLDADVPPYRAVWTADEAAALPTTLFTGVEIASSPLASINRLGPRAVVADFGNNNGLVIGAEIADWPRQDESALRAQTYIEEVLVGEGGAQQLSGGLRAALAFALTRAAQRGYPLRKGQWIATGNATGIHDILPGQRARVVFAGHGEIRLLAQAASGQHNGSGDDGFNP